MYICTYVCYFTAFQQPLVAMPSESCVGDAVTLSCEVLFTHSDGTSELAGAIFKRGDDKVTGSTPNHRILRDGPITIGVLVSNVTLDDDGIKYTCEAAGNADVVSSLILNVTGTYVCIII